MIIYTEIKFYVETCCNCGIPFAVSEEFNAECRRKGKLFFCPNGHSQSYGKSEADKIRDEKVALEHQLQAKLNEARHMAVKHKDFALPAAHQKAIEGSVQ